MKVFNSKLAAIGLAAFVFASCSDSNSDPVDGPNGVKSEVNSVELAVSTPSTVINYKNSTANARKFFLSRANDASFITTMPNVPTMPNLKSELNEAIDLEAVENSPVNNTYVIKNKKKLDFTGKKIKGVTIFVSGDAKLTYDNSLGGNTIILEKGGTLEYNGTGSMIKPNDKVYCKLSGEVKATNGPIIVEGELYGQWRGQGAKDEIDGGIGKTENNVNPTQDITFKSGSKAYIDGSIRAKKLTIEDGAVVTATKNILNATTVDLAGALKVNGFCETGDLNITGLLDASETTAAVKASSHLNLENGSLIKANYINVTNNTYVGDKDNKKPSKIGEAELNLKNGGKIQIADFGVINVNNLNTDNASQQVILQGTGSVAVVKADKFTNNGGETINAFSTPGEGSFFLMQLSKCFAGTTEMPSSGSLDISASYLDYDKATEGTLVQFKDQSHKQYGYVLNDAAKNAKATPKLDLVAAFGNNNGSSASCIQTEGNYIYVSYHKHGNGSTNMGGGLEVLHINGNQIAADQEVTPSTNMDFNHLIVADSKVYVAGSDVNKGAFLGVVPMNGNTLTTGNEAMTQYVLDALHKNNGYDANCVVKYGDNIVMSSTRGYELYDKNFTHTWFQTDKDVKGLAAANGKLYGLVATGNDEKGFVNVFSGVDFRQNAATTTFNTTMNVGPKDGKNTVAVDGTDIYVCHGSAGLVCYDANGNKKWEYTVPVIQNELSEKYGAVKGYCNGVAVDNNYVYVAAGGYGLVVLNKADGKELCHRIAFNGKLENGQWVVANSANYVTIGQDGNIYVAYGKNRVQVFKLTQTKK